MVYLGEDEDFWVVYDVFLLMCNVGFDGFILVDIGIED